MRIKPTEFWKSILSTGFAKNTAAVKYPNDKHAQGYLPVAFIVLNKEYIEDEQVKEKIKKACKQKLPEYACQKSIILLTIFRLLQ